MKKTISNNKKQKNVSVIKEHMLINYLKTKQTYNVLISMTTIKQTSAEP